MRLSTDAPVAGGEAWRKTTEPHRVATSTPAPPPACFGSSSAQRGDTSCAPTSTSQPAAAASEARWRSSNARTDSELSWIAAFGLKNVSTKMPTVPPDTAASLTDAISCPLSKRVSVVPTQSARTVNRPALLRSAGLAVHLPFPVSTVVVPPFTFWMAYSPSLPTPSR